MLRPSLIPILAVALSASPAALSDDLLPAEKPALAFEGMIEVSEVLLDVVAIDVEGRFVTGLGRDDFIVEEDGESVELTSVSFYSTRYSSEEADADGEAARVGEAPGVGEAPASRYFIFFFDNRWARRFHVGDLRRLQQRAGLQSRRWLEEEMQPSDWVAVVSYGSRLYVYQDFTQDRDALALAVLDAAAGWAPTPRRARSDELFVMRRMPQGTELRRSTRTVFGALEVVAEACAPVAGRKNLLMFTIGLGEERRFGTDGTDPDYYPKIEVALNDHNVAVYPIDLSPSGRGTQQTSFLNRLAHDTGGAYHQRDFYGLMTSLRDIGGENYAYYVLSYQSEHPAGEVGYQRVEVKVRDQRVQVRARKGYRYGL